MAKLTQAETAAVVEHYNKLDGRRFEIEGRFDAATLLVAGGAFTVSATVVPRLAESGNASWALLSSWVAWGLCLALCVGGHLLSARCLSRRLDLIHEKNFDAALWAKSFLDKSIPWVNRATFALLVAGFALFGAYTYSNLGIKGSSPSNNQTTKPTEASTKGDRDSDGGQKANQASTETGGLLGDHRVQASSTVDHGGRGAEGNSGEQRASPAAGLSQDTKQGQQQAGEVADGNEAKSTAGTATSSRPITKSTHAQ